MPKSWNALPCSDAVHGKEETNLGCAIFLDLPVLSIRWWGNRPTLSINPLPVETYRIHSGTFWERGVWGGIHKDPRESEHRIQPSLKGIWNPGCWGLRGSGSHLPFSERVPCPLTPLPSAQLLYLSKVSASGRPWLSCSDQQCLSDQTLTALTKVTKNDSKFPTGRTWLFPRWPWTWPSESQEAGTHNCLVSRRHRANFPRRDLTQFPADQFQVRVKTVRRERISTERHVWNPDKQITVLAVGAIAS